MHGYLRTFALFIVFSVLFVGIGAIVAQATGMDQNAALIFFFSLSLLMNIFAFFFSSKIVLWSTKATIVTPEQAPRLHRIVDRVVLRAGIPKPRVAIMMTQTPNAFATGRNPKNAVVAATDGILRMLDDDELEGVIAHEISHVQNRDVLITTIAAVFASAISFMAYAMLFARDRNANPLAALLLFFLAPLAAMLVQMAITRSREYAADASGAKLLGHGETLARALVKIEQGVQVRPLRQGNPAQSSLYIVNPFRGGSMVGLFRTHPSTADRVRRLRELRF